MNTQATEVLGTMMGVTGLRLSSPLTKGGRGDLVSEDNILKVDGLFVAVGSTPFTRIVDGLAPEKDTEGCLVVDKRQETTVKGLYAAGDVTTNSNKFRQTIMSAAEGCLAANSVHEDMLRLGH
jgi:thioredoxin reductase (NADPH)